VTSSELRHVRFTTLKMTSGSYNPGDVAVIHPITMDSEVDSFLVTMGWANDADTPFSITHTMLGACPSAFLVVANQ